MFRKLQSLVVVVFFFWMMTMLVRDHVIPSFSRGAGIQIDRAVLTDSWVNVDDYTEMRLGDNLIGSMRNTADQDILPAGEPESYTTTSHVQIDAGGLLRARVMVAAKMNRRLEVESARVRAHLPGFGRALYDPEVLNGEELPAGAYELLARIDGLQLRYRLRRDNAVKYESTRLVRPVTMVDSIAPILRGQMMTKNITYNIDIIDPLGGDSMASNVEIEWVENQFAEVNGERVDLRLIEMRFGQFKSTLLVDAVGTVMRREIPLFQAGGAGPGGGMPSLIFSRLEPQDAQQKYAELRTEILLPAISEDDVKGENQGEIGGLNLFSMIGGAK